MKTFNLSKSAKFFLSGTVFGIVLISLFSFYGIPPTSTLKTISVTDANRYFKNYLTSGEIVKPDTIKGVSIEMEQYTAMKNLMTQDPTLTGFRIYFGRDTISNNISIVVGVKSDGSDATAGKIYSSSRIKMGICPPLCDAGSRITQP